MFARTKLCAGLALAFGGSLLLASNAAFAQTQRIEITGSHIKRVDTEAVAPVDIITREQIERSGQPTVAEVIRNIPSNTGSFGESFSNSFAPGAAGISLRGLGQKTTLVLINGRRTAGYGFAQNLQDTFVDLNSIPSSAVERIEILKDGASAIYGSDAIAGVVNIILRKDFRGLEASLAGGSFEGKKDYQFTLTGGIGDLAADKFNVFGVLDYYKRDLLLFSDTKFMASRDFRNQPGGRNFQSLTGGGTWQDTVTGQRRAITDCRGTVMTGPQAVAAGLINTTNGANAALSAATNTFCTYDFNSQFTALPGTERIGALVRGTKELSATATGYAEVGLSRVDTFQTFQAPFFAGTTGLTATPAGLRPFTYNINFAPGVAGNPFPNVARYVGVLQDMGTRDSDIRTDSARVLVGATYTLGTWDLDSGLGYSVSDTSSTSLNRLSLAGTSATFGVPTTPQPPIPLSSASTYNLDRWTTNSQAVRDGMRADFPRKSLSELRFIDTRASTSLGKMNGADIGLAIGGEHREEKLNDKPDPLASSGGVLGQGITATNGSRSNDAFYAELALPFSSIVEVQAALRYDRYSDYGSSTTPKIGVKVKPMDSLLLRANWGKGFRAPTLPEISPSVATFFTTVVDPEDGVQRQISGVFAGNPNLKAETSISRTFGIVFEPNRNWNLAIDFYKIDWRNVVASRSFQDILDESCPAGGPGCPATTNILRDPANANAVVTILSNYENLAKRVTSGVDVDTEWKIPTDFGRFTLHAGGVYVKSFKEDDVECVGSNGCTNTYPRVRGNLSLDFDRDSWAITGRVNYTHSVYQQLLGASFFTAQDPRFQNGVLPDRVGSYTSFDLYARYNITKNLTVSGAILNLTDKTPPYDTGFSSTSLHDFSLYDPRGRQFRIGVNYKM